MENAQVPQQPNPIPANAGVSGSSNIPGGQNNARNLNQAGAELNKLLFRELINAGKAGENQDARGWALAMNKMRQIKQAALALGAPQGAPQPPAGGQSGVPTPVARPTDAITGRPLG